MSQTHWALPPIDSYASGVSPHASIRWDAQVRSTRSDVLIEELPVSLELIDTDNPSNTSAIVMMATPIDLEAFALGFALTEGLIESPSQIRGLHVVPAKFGMAVMITLASGLWQRAQTRRRDRPVGSSCGLCGLADMQAALHAPKVVCQEPPSPRFSPAAITAAFKALPSLQTLGTQTGASHAAAFVNVQGEVTVVAEDAGRHNALDKLVGKLALAGLSPHDGFCAISSRASFEMVQKAARVGFPLLAAISAPTALAVRLAQESGITLCAFVRGDRLTCFAHAQRLGDTI